MRPVPASARSTLSATAASLALGSTTRTSPRKRSSNAWIASGFPLATPTTACWRTTGRTSVTSFSCQRLADERLVAGQVEIDAVGRHAEPAEQAAGIIGLDANFHAVATLVVGADFLDRLQRPGRAQKDQFLATPGSRRGRVNCQSPITSPAVAIIMPQRTSHGWAMPARRRGKRCMGSLTCHSC